MYKATYDSVWVADPSLGNVEYSREDFCSGWFIQDSVEAEEGAEEGIALLLELM